MSWPLRGGDQLTRNPPELSFHEIPAGDVGIIRHFKGEKGS